MIEKPEIATYNLLIYFFSIYTFIKLAMFRSWYSFTEAYMR